jgi:hypothetical protein
MVWLTRDPVLFLACELLQALVIGQMGPDAVESAPTTEDMIWWGRGPGLRYSTVSVEIIENSLNLSRSHTTIFEIRKSTK